MELNKDVASLTSEDAIGVNELEEKTKNEYTRKKRKAVIDYINSECSTLIVVIKTGNNCPICGKANEAKQYEVITKDFANGIADKCFKCDVCDVYYMTQKSTRGLSKNIRYKPWLSILHDTFDISLPPRNYCKGFEKEKIESPKADNKKISRIIYAPFDIDTLILSHNNVCPRCGKENSTTRFDVLDDNNIKKEINGRKCPCGQQYLMANDLKTLPETVTYVTPKGKRKHYIKKEKKVNIKKKNRKNYDISRDIEKKRYIGTSLERFLYS